MILESYDSLSALGHSESGSRGNPIVTHKSSWLQARIDLLLKGLHIDFIEINLVASGGISISTLAVSIMAVSKGQETDYEASLFLGKGSGFWKMCLYSGLNHLSSPAKAVDAKMAVTPAEMKDFMVKRYDLKTVGIQDVNPKTGEQV